MWGDGKKIKVIVMKKNNKMSADDVAGGTRNAQLLFGSIKW